MLLGVINDGSVLLEIDPPCMHVLKGGAYVIAVILDHITCERQEHHRRTPAQQEHQQVRTSLTPSEPARLEGAALEPLCHS
jgi:hypothetical protein